MEQQQVEQTVQLTAVYEEGVLRPIKPLNLREHEEVEIIIRRRRRYRRFTREELRASYIAARPLVAAVAREFEELDTLAADALD